MCVCPSVRPSYCPSVCCTANLSFSFKFGMHKLYYNIYLLLHAVYTYVFKSEREGPIDFLADIQTIEQFSILIKKLQPYLLHQTFSMYTYITFNISLLSDHYNI